LCTAEDSAAAEFDGNAYNSPNGGSRMPRRKRPKAKLARKGRSNMYDACVQSMERVHKNVCYICRETVNACGDARQRVQRIAGCICRETSNAFVATVDRFQRCACYMHSSPFVTLLVLLTLAICVGKWHSERIAHSSPSPPSGLKAWNRGSRNHPLTEQYYDRDHASCATFAPP